MKSWFPIPVEQIDNETFRTLTPVEKLYYWTLVSEFNLNGKFYQRDAWFAAALKVSEDKIRDARRKFQRLGWVEVKPGFRSGGKNIATTYLNVKWANVPEKGQFVQFQRYLLELLLAYVRKSKLSHPDVVVYVYIYSWRQRKHTTILRESKRMTVSYVTKTQLQDMTNITNAKASLKRLFDGFKYKGGDPLFTYRDAYHKYYFDEWNTPVDPSENEGSALNAETYRREIDEEATRIRDRKTAKEKEKARASGQVFAEDLRDYFVTLYKLYFAKSPVITYNDDERLEDIGSKYDPQRVADAMQHYMSTEIMPYSDRKNSKTLSNFLNHIGSFIESETMVTLTTPVASTYLVDVFDQLYKNRYGRSLARRSMRLLIDKLNGLGEKYGVDLVAQAMERYVMDKSLPIALPPDISTRSLGFFVSNIEVFVSLITSPVF